MRCFLTRNPDRAKLLPWLTGDTSLLNCHQFIQNVGVETSECDHSFRNSEKYSNIKLKPAQFEDQLSKFSEVTYCHIDVDDVTFTQSSVIGDTVTSNIIHRRTHRFRIIFVQQRWGVTTGFDAGYKWKKKSTQRAKSERRNFTGSSCSSHSLTWNKCLTIVNNFVDLIGGDSRLDSFTRFTQNVSRPRTRLPHPVNLLRWLHLQHKTAVRKNCTCNWTLVANTRDRSFHNHAARWVAYYSLSFSLFSFLPLRAFHSPSFRCQIRPLPNKSRQRDKQPDKDRERERERERENSLWCCVFRPVLIFCNEQINKL